MGGLQWVGTVEGGDDGNLWEMRGGGWENHVLMVLGRVMLDFLKRGMVCWDISCLMDGIFD